MPDEKRGRFTVGWPSIARRPFIAIDELGTEEKETNYGEPYEPFCKVIDEAENYLKPLFITTNLTTEQILDRYDERTLDRIIRLCKIVKFEGGSFRK